MFLYMLLQKQFLLCGWSWDSILCVCAVPIVIRLAIISADCTSLDCFYLHFCFLLSPALGQPTFSVSPLLSVSCVQQQALPLLSPMLQLSGLRSLAEPSPSLPHTLPLLLVPQSPLGAVCTSSAAQCPLS